VVMVRGKTVLTVTANPAIDKNTEIDVVVPDKKLRCAAPMLDPGGGGINVSRALNKLGYPSCAVYLSGGHSGGLLDDLLEAEGIARRCVPVGDEIRVNLIVYEISTGRQYRFGFPGRNITQQECEALLSEIPRASCDGTPPGFIVASGSLPQSAPMDFYAKTVRIANELGAKSVVDTSGEALKEALKERVCLLKTNLLEFRYLTGSPVESDDEIAALGSRMIERGNAEYVVISLGGRGAIGVWNGGFLRIPAPEVPTKSVIGAGDSMVAGLVLKLAMGKSFA